MPSFVTAQALDEMARQALSIAHLAYPGPTEVSPYFFNYQLGKKESSILHYGPRVAEIEANTPLYPE